MAIQTTTAITIKGKPIRHFERLFLNQSLADHHFFEIVVRLDEFETNGVVLQNTQDLIGEQITINTSVLQGLGSFNTSVFSGIVTEISNNLSHHGNRNRITIKGYSPTILTDNSANCASFIDKTLGDVVENALSEYPGNLLGKTVKPLNNQSLAYTVQYNETDFRFIHRLAHANGEWFYYNGSELIFGQESGDTVELAYGYDLHEFNLSVAINNPKFNYISNDYLEAKEEEFDSASVSVGMNGLNGAALEKSEKVFTKTPSAMNNRYFTERQTKRELEQAAEIQKKANVGKMVILKGSSDNPGLKLGCTISIQDQLQSGPQPFGEYRITSITHQCNSMGHYINFFEAVPVAVMVPPYANVSIYPRSESQSAIVMDNKDPEGLKRLKVQFSWQKATGETTPWVRMLTPHAGGGKGFYFVPEIGEEVMIDFEGGNAEKPYIIGTKFNAQAKSDFYDKDNNFKAIQTRSGHIIKLDDKDGQESIVIADKNNDLIHFDTKEKTITISTPEKILMNSKFIKLTADDIELHAKNTKIVSSDNFTSQSGDSQISMNPSMITDKSATITLDGSEVITKGDSIKSNSTADTQITSGGLVKINS